MKLKILFFLLICAACSDDDAIPPVSCDNVGCTLQFVTINVKVQDQDGVNIPLDDFKVTDKITGDDLTASYTDTELDQFRQSGSYPLYDDRFVQGNQNEKRGIVFSGAIDGEDVVNSSYVVQADCCHVSLFSGNLSITLNR